MVNGFVLYLEWAEGKGFQMEDGTILEFHGTQYHVNYAYVDGNGDLIPFGVGEI